MTGKKPGSRPRGPSLTTLPALRREAGRLYSWLLESRVGKPLSGRDALAGATLLRLVRDILVDSQIEARVTALENAREQAPLRRAYPAA